MTDPLVERISRRIAEAARPDKIILFGSWAKGTARPDFSMDLFLITSDALESQKRIANTLTREVAEHGAAC